MRQLIISDYDSATNFTWVIIDNIVEVVRGFKPIQLAKFGLYDKEWMWFDEKLIDFNKNKSIQDFDMIIVCEDGGINIHKNSKRRKIKYV